MAGGEGAVLGPSWGRHNHSTPPSVLICEKLFFSVMGNFLKRWSCVSDQEAPRRPVSC